MRLRTVLLIFQFLKFIDGRVEFPGFNVNLLLVSQLYDMVTSSSSEKQRPDVDTHWMAEAGLNV